MVRMDHQSDRRLRHSLPTPVEVCRPLLAILRLYEVDIRASETYAPLADAFELSGEARAQELGAFKGSRVSNPALPAWPYMVNRAVARARHKSRRWVAPASSTDHAIWRLTKRGERIADTVLKQNPHYHTILLRGWPEVGTEPTTPLTEGDFEEEWESRQMKAIERERIGLLGERLCYDSERARLQDLGRDDLASRVTLVSRLNGKSGYDLLTFDDEGQPIHVEVKTTTLARASGRGFWLTANEIDTAERDPLWNLWRVWDADGKPTIERYGNPIYELPVGWSREASTWHFRPAVGPS